MLDVLDTPWRDAIILEHKVQKIILAQQNHGWLLDQDRCRMLVGTLVNLIKETDDILLPNIKPRIINEGEVPAPFKKDGSLLERVKKYYESDVCPVRGPFSKVTFETINLGSAVQLKEYLFSIGWKPDEWNEHPVTGEQTSPKLTTTSLLKLGKPGELIDHRTVLVHRKNQLLGFLRNVRPDGRIEARANTLGTGTHRMSQNNVVNVPKAKSYVFFGKEMRSVFTVPDGYVLLGGDAAGLEIRLAIHYLNNPDLIPLVVSGDIHVKYLELNKAFLSNRDVAKTSIYAFLFEAGDWMLGNIADIQPRGFNKESIGQTIRNNMDKILPGLNKLIADTQREAGKGWIRGLDGRRIGVRQSPFNSRIQSSGAIFMKQVLVYLDEFITHYKLDAHLVGSFHDEFQYEVKEDQAEIVKELFRGAIVKAAKRYDLKCPMDGEVKIGKRWNETH